MQLLFIFLLTFSTLFANIATIIDSIGRSQLLRDGKSITVVQKQQLKVHDIIKTGNNAKVKIFFKDNTAVSLGQNTSFEIDTYLFTGKKDSQIKFRVLKGFFKTVTGEISKIAPQRFKLQTKNATIGIRGTVFAAQVGVKADVVMCTDGRIILFTPSGNIEVGAGSKVNAGNFSTPKVKAYTQQEKEQLIKSAGWYGSMSLKKLIKYIRENFKEPLRGQLLSAIQNILNKDSDERRKYIGKPKSKNADDKSFVDNITINDREFDSLIQRTIEFYPEDLKNGKIIIQGLLESDDKNTPLSTLHVEITTDGGESWSRARGSAEWEWSFTPELEKSYEFSLRVVTDEKADNTPIKIAGAGIVAQEFQKTDIKIPVLKKQIKFTPKTITTEPIILKFKKFAPKVITTEPIILKFKKFTPKVITTEPIILKLKQPEVYYARTQTLKLKLKQPEVYYARTPTLKLKLKLKLKQPEVYYARTQILKLKLKQPEVYYARTQTLKLKLK